MFILQSENYTQTSLSPAKGLFSHSVWYIVCRPIRVTMLFLPCKVKHMRLQNWPGQDQPSAFKSLFSLSILNSTIFIKSYIYSIWPSFEYFALLSLLANNKNLRWLHTCISCQYWISSLYLSSYFFLFLKQNQTKPAKPASWCEEGKIQYCCNFHPGEILRYADNKISRYFMYINTHKDAHTFYTYMDIHGYISIFMHMWEIQCILLHHLNWWVTE